MGGLQAQSLLWACLTSAYFRCALHGTIELLVTISFYRQFLAYGYHDFLRRRRWTRHNDTMAITKVDRLEIRLYFHSMFQLLDAVFEHKLRVEGIQLGYLERSYGLGVRHETRVRKWHRCTLFVDLVS